MMSKSMICGLFAAILTMTGISASGLSTHTPHSGHLCAGLVPENNLQIPANMFAAGGITKNQFNQVIERVKSIYEPEIRSMGGSLTINGYWDDSTVNANAVKFGNDRVINIYGGLARFYSVDVEGLALAVCHELGHHLGGGPKYSEPNDWGGLEGTADYFATLKCLRRYFASEDNERALAGKKIDPTAKAACEAQYPNAREKFICLRASLASEQLAEMYQMITQSGAKPKFNTPETYQVTELYEEYPTPQCRMDTYLQGMLCRENEYTRMSDTDFKQGSCYAPRDKVGARPGCWFVAN
ncbi:hypothetical protein [Bdellovibrio sp. GT3]|uniref:hypothetical protein n=1 Tax=Bdellovibrio sp. GT3 TaxID=3136282 RepID=UPI0030F05168